ncbi:PQQ-dependent sugar dehydrogenase [Methanolobus sp.]|jgi:glucose/arabinose dehydrogenase|uniref:PQQ-dependent sugar dehydrogenase n=1 Tax=Methanolobus sp. TaxID=1874737 RepID=UPI002600BE9D|nr:PQQ-dependent sugar dehydrogenase [Methanolobus sp.]
MSRLLIGLRVWWIAVVFIVIVFLVVFSANYLGLRPTVTGSGVEGIDLPPAFAIDVYADDLGSTLLSFGGPSPGPRMMMIKDDLLFVSIPNKGLIAVLPDRNGDNLADEVQVFISDLDYPHSTDYYDGWFYIAEESRVIRVRDDDNDLVADEGSLQVLIDTLPTGGHYTRTVKVHNGELYLSLGSSCNVCYESNDMRAAISKSDLDGSNFTVFAKGLRNSVGLAFHPLTGDLYGTDNGRDWLGDDLPPDEINHITEGGDYGWPECYGKNIYDTDFNTGEYTGNLCNDTGKIPSFVDLQAHSAPLGLTFYDGDSFPEEYQGDLFVCFHGSWNRQEPTGYKVVSIDMDTREVSDFATGWLRAATISGRPVDVVVADDGSLFVSDDNAGKIYRIYYTG